eukprot:6223279-Prymnesium_polylepis.1
MRRADELMMRLPEAIVVLPPLTKIAPPSCTALESVTVLFVISTWPFVRCTTPPLRALETAMELSTTFTVPSVMYIAPPSSPANEFVIMLPSSMLK